MHSHTYCREENQLHKIIKKHQHVAVYYKQGQLLRWVNVKHREQKSVGGLWNTDT